MKKIFKITMFSILFLILSSVMILLADYVLDRYSLLDKNLLRLTLVLFIAIINISIIKSMMKEV